jgi:hypothetical protein
MTVPEEVGSGVTSPPSGSLHAANPMTIPQMTLLITVTGRDRPGVTSRLFSILAAHDLSVSACCCPAAVPPT